MLVRKSVSEDLDRILDIYAHARKFMASVGNPKQWADGWPSEEIVARDVLPNGNGYVIVNDDGKIIGVFAFILGIDPTYIKIENGSWLNDLPYGTIHRIASSGEEKGIFKTCLDFCLTKTDNIRIDTHTDNRPMRNLMKKYGFIYCGIIYCRDNEPRLAFQKC